MVGLFLYKNFLLTILLIGYLFIADFSGTKIFNPSILVGYNTFFTTFPLVFLGLFQQDVNEETLANQPSIYALGPMNKFFNMKILL